ncbi:MAG: hypothetical protein AAB868_02835 [Patescibacteria group bacterium]
MDDNLDLSKNTELNNALKEFETKNIGQSQPIQETLSVLTAQKNYKVPEFTPKMVQWVMKISGGAIKEQKQAEYMLFGFVVVAIIVSLFLFFGGGGTAGNPKDIKILPAVF